MLRIKYLALGLTLVAMGLSAQTVEQTAGIYYAYPGPQHGLTEAPDDYEPFYISHYGRHGSRWITDDKRYTDVTDALDRAGALTPLGKDVRRRLDIVLDDALGRSGSLSPVGERQHRDIGARMYERFPQVFAGSATVNAVSSTSLRCAMSMSYFTESLKEHNPALCISRTAYDRDMDYIAHTSAEGKAFSADTAAWRTDYKDFVAQTVHPERLIASLIADPDKLSPEEQLKLATGLYWIASDMQDTDLDLSFYDIFTYDELRSFWRCINARMYMCNGNAPLADGVMIHCADNLLTDIISRADSALSGGERSADLRFGHDTHLLRLLALMGIEGCDLQETDMALFEQVWRDYSMSPMAANLQMIFYRRPADGDVIVKVLLNEDEVSMPLDTIYPSFYKWSDLRERLTTRLQSSKQ